MTKSKNHNKAREKTFEKHESAFVWCVFMMKFFIPGNVRGLSFPPMQTSEKLEESPKLSPLFHSLPCTTPSRPCSRTPPPPHSPTSTAPLQSPPFVRCLHVSIQSTVNVRYVTSCFLHPVPLFFLFPLSPPKTQLAHYHTRRYESPP